MPQQDQNRNDQSIASSEYTTSPAPSTNTSYSTDFDGKPGWPSGSAQSAAAYCRAMSELMAAARVHPMSNDVDHQRAKTEPRDSGRGSAVRHGGSEMPTSSGRGQQPIADNDHLLTAPVVSLSPYTERVSFYTLYLHSMLSNGL